MEFKFMFTTLISFTKTIIEYEFISIRFAIFNRFTNIPLAVFKDKTYNLPFNMNTFDRIWGVKTPNEAKDVVKK